MDINGLTNSSALGSLCAMDIAKRPFNGRGNTCCFMGKCCWLGLHWSMHQGQHRNSTLKLSDRSPTQWYIRPVIGRCILTLTLGMNAGCSLLFTISDGEVDTDATAETADAETADAETETADAETGTADAAVLGCSSLSDTIAMFSLDSKGSTIQDSSNGLVGAYSRFTSSFIEKAPTLTSGVCGDGWQKPNRELGMFPAHLFPDTQSVDFWFKFDEATELPIMSLLAKDGPTSEVGDFALDLYKGNNGYHPVVRMQYITDDEIGVDVYSCGAEVAPGQWHHIAVSFISTKVTIFVDGGQMEPSLNLSLGCNTKDGISLDTLPGATDRTWVFGMSNAGDTVPLAPVQTGFVGQLDELRFRSALFTLEDAKLVFNAP